MQHKSASIIAIIITLTSFVIAPAVFVWVVDPFQVYHKSFFNKAGYGNYQVYQHAGWIHRLLADPQEDYQGIVIGSSTMANYTQTLINQYLPWGNVMNLSANGSSPRMQHATARFALEKNPQLKHLLWDIHSYYVFDPDPDEDNTQLKFPYYLYNHALWDDHPYFFNSTNMETGLRFLKGNFSDFTGGVEDNGPFYETLLAQGQYDAYGTRDNRQEVLLPQLQNIQHKQPDAADYHQQQFPSLDQYLLSLILPMCNSDKDIVITFSPAARIFYASMADLNYLQRQLLMRRYVMEKTHACKNIRVFAFDNVDWITADLNNYADFFHFRLNINHYILSSIAKAENQLTPDNISMYEAQFINNLNAYHSLFMSELKM